MEEPLPEVEQPPAALVTVKDLACASRYYAACCDDTAQQSRAHSWVLQGIIRQAILGQGRIKQGRLGKIRTRNGGRAEQRQSRAGQSKAGRGAAGQAMITDN